MHCTEVFEQGLFGRCVVQIVEIMHGHPVDRPTVHLEKAAGLGRAPTLIAVEGFAGNLAILVFEWLKCLALPLQSVLGFFHLEGDSP